MSVGLARRALQRVAGFVSPPPRPVQAAPGPAPAPGTRIEPTEASIRGALSLVEDPEVGIDIVNLGLLRGWEVEGDVLRVRLTMTSTACPVGPHIADAAQQVLADAFVDHTCLVKLVPEPPWSPDDMSEQARAWFGNPQSLDPERQSMDTTLDIRPIPPRDRHPLIFDTFAALPGGGGFVLVNDHDPKPLYYQFQAEYGPVFGWEYLERGPETWKVRISRVA